jgi:hypothetical protein
MGGAALAEVRHVNVPGFYAVIKKIDGKHFCLFLKTHPEGESVKVLITPKTLFYKKRFVKGRLEYAASFRDFALNDFIYVTTDNLKARPIVARGIYESNTLTMMALRMRTDMELYGKVTRHIPEKSLLEFTERSGQVSTVALGENTEIVKNNRKAPLEKFLKGEEATLLIGFPGTEGYRPQVSFALSLMDRKTYVTRKLMGTICPDATEGIVSAVDMKNSVLKLNVAGEVYRFYFDEESVWALGKKVDSPDELKGRTLMIFYTVTSKKGLLYMCEAIDEKAILETYEMLVQNKGVVPVKKKP